MSLLASVRVGKDEGYIVKVDRTGIYDMYVDRIIISMTWIYQCSRHQIGPSFERLDYTKQTFSPTLMASIESSRETDQREVPPFFSPP